MQDFLTSKSINSLVAEKHHVNLEDYQGNNFWTWILNRKGLISGRSLLNINAQCLLNRQSTPYWVKSVLTLLSQEIADSFFCYIES